MSVPLLRDRRRPLVLAALVALLVGVTVATLAGIVSFSASTQMVSHTHQVLGQIEAVRSALGRTESAARGFRLTSDPTLDADYIADRPQPLAEADALVALVSDNPPQQERARALRQLVRVRLAQIGQSLDLQAEGRGAEANRRMVTVNRRTAGAIDHAAAAMSAVEQRLLAERRSTTRRDAWGLAAVVVLGLVVALVMLTSLLRMLDREARRARALELDARDALAVAETTAAQRELLAEQRRVLAAFAGLLHSCQSVDEALEVAGNALAQLVPESGGVCYSMRASQNLLERRSLFGTQRDDAVEALRPDQCWGLRRGGTHAFDPAQPTARCEHLRGASAACSLCVPLTSQGAVLGLLHVAAPAGSMLSDMERAAVESVAEHLAVVLHGLELRETLRVQSLRDPLTGLYNRRYLDESLPREIERCERRGRPLSVLMLDVDHFKRFNDAHGHGAGDALLTRVGQVLGAVTRGEDIACRFGGEEFIVVMPEASAEQAHARAEQIREAIAETTISYMRRELGPVSVSIGLGVLRAGMDSPETLVAGADRALYAAKAQGRNRVVTNVHGAAAAAEASDA